MNRTMKKILSAIFAVLLLWGGLAIPSAAEESVLFDLDERRNMAISVAYEKDAPEISFIAPNGKAYGADAISAGDMEFYDSGSVLYFRIPNAMAGEWKIVYDKKNNDEIEVACAPYAEAISIDEFIFKKGDDDDELDTAFTVSYADSDDFYNYVIWAVVTEGDSVVGQTQLRTGSARANEEREVTVNISSLATYSKYQLMLEVYMDVGGAEVFDTLVSEETFSYTDPDAPKAIDGFDVEVGVTDSYIRMDWEKQSVHCNGYIVVIYADGKDEPVYTAELGSDVHSTEVLVDLSVSFVTCEIAYKNNRGRISEYASRRIDLSNKNALTFVCDEVTSAAEGKVEYDFTSYGDPVRTVLDVNGKVEEALPEGKGSFSLKLDENNNDVSIKWYAAEDLSFTVNAQVYSDRTAPVLLLYEATGDIVTDKGSYILTGSTDPGCTVTVGDKTAEVDENGIFTVTLDLADGENEFTVTATGKTGNSSKQVVTVEKLAPVMNMAEASGPLSVIVSFLPLILSLLLAAAVCVFVFVNSSLYGKKKTSSGKLSAVFAALRNTFIFVGVIAVLCAVFFTVMTVKSASVLNTVEFFKAASESVSLAYEMMEESGAWRICMIVSFAVLVLSCILAVLCGILSSKTGGKGVSKNAPKPSKPSVSAQPVQPPVQNSVQSPSQPAMSEENKTVQTPPSPPVNADVPAQPVQPSAKAPEESKDAPAQSEEKPDFKFCPECGKKTPYDALFCGECGYKF